MIASELRIGNLVKGNSRGGTHILDIEVLKYIDETKSGYSPIPLTEEWLVKFGFKKYFGWDKMAYWHLPKDEQNMSRFELFEVANGLETPSEKICEFVHQLQNCYYFHELSGEELTI